MHIKIERRFKLTKKFLFEKFIRDNFKMFERIFNKNVIDNEIFFIHKLNEADRKTSNSRFKYSRFESRKNVQSQKQFIDRMN